jgi:hypothetical protein
VSAAVAAVAALFAAWAVYYARKAYRMQRAEHEAFLAELKRCAEISITINQTSCTSEESAARKLARVVLRLEFDNTGSKAAREAIVNVLIPRSITGFRRSREDGTEHSTDRNPPVASDQEVPWSEPSQLLSWRYDIVTQATRRVSFVSFLLDPAKTCPVHVTLSSDDLARPYDVARDFIAEDTVHTGSSDTLDASLDAGANSADDG